MQRPEIARIRGVAADSAVAGLVERGLIARPAGTAAGGAVRYRTTPLFERVFGLASLAELPRLDDLGADADAIRERLEAAVAEQRRRSDSHGPKGRGLVSETGHGRFPGIGGLGTRSIRVVAMAASDLTRL